MVDRKILFFIKFFQNEEWADDFMKGRIYLNRLSIFKKIEAFYDDDERLDTNEAVAMWWQPRGFHMIVSNPVFGNIEITEKDLAAPTSMSFEYHDHFHVLCLHSIYTSGLPLVDVNRRFHLAEGQLDELHKQLHIDPRCFRFGRFAVVIFRPRPFLTRITEVLHGKGRDCQSNLVHYYDDTTFDGEVPPRRIVFHKPKRFEYQREYRIAVAPKLLGTDPLIVDIGDISHLCGKTSSEKLNELLQVKLDMAA
jgi:hypothetical protein